MPSPISFQIHSTSGQARAGHIQTPHGGFDTPAFMPVGTRASVKGIFPHHIRATGAQILLNNTFHLMQRPGSTLIKEMGGVHKFMNWDGPILTDSGGYQAYSMADINAIDEDGVSFKSILDGSTIRLTPEVAIRVQNELGPDIMMAFDDCPPSVDPQAGPTNQVRIKLAASRDAVKEIGYNHNERLNIANERTLRWLDRCKAAHARPDEQALFGIIQGGADLARRDWCIQRICNIDLPGYAIGGVAVGESTEDIARIVRHTAPQMPGTKPRYLMGVGYDHDITAAVLAGIDMFDCVLPTRNGRNANAFTNDPDTDGQLRLKNAKYANDQRPIEPGCDCPACNPASHNWATYEGRPFSRAYIRHLIIANEMLGPILVTLHNLRYFQRLMNDLRVAITADDWAPFKHKRPRLAHLIGEHQQISPRDP